jgi:hypothetical protein
VKLRFFAEAMDRPSPTRMRYAAVNCSAARPLRKNALQIAGKINAAVISCSLAKHRVLNYPRGFRLVSTYAIAAAIAKFFP